MPDELVDMVNEKDEVIGQKTKSAYHKEGVWHRISCVILFNSQGKIWLQMRKKEQDKWRSLRLLGFRTYRSRPEL